MLAAAVGVAALLVVGVVRWARGYVADLADRLDVLEARVSDVEALAAPTERRATEPPAETMAVHCDWEA